MITFQLHRVAPPPPSHGTWRATDRGPGSHRTCASSSSRTRDDSSRAWPRSCLRRKPLKHTGCWRPVAYAGPSTSPSDAPSGSSPHLLRPARGPIRVQRQPSPAPRAFDRGGGACIAPFVGLCGRRRWRGGGHCPASTPAARSRWARRASSGVAPEYVPARIRWSILFVRARSPASSARRTFITRTGAARGSMSTSRASPCSARMRRRRSSNKELPPWPALVQCVTAAGAVVADVPLKALPNQRLYADALQLRAAARTPCRAPDRRDQHDLSHPLARP